MKLGVATVVADEGIRPHVLAKALEDRGFDLRGWPNIHTCP
jgi:hypothetical protein